MAKAGKGNVGSADPTALLRGVGKDVLAVGFGLAFVGVVFDGDGRVGKLDRPVSLMADVSARRPVAKC